jgi:hypothetical protein
MKGRKARSTGGADEAEEDIKDKPADRSAPNKVAEEAEEMKKGGRAKRKHGGKMVGKVEGEKAPMHAGRKPRKSGGKATSDANPFTSARKGEDPPGRKVMKGELGMGED